ncbi:MAG: acyl-CoA desaturase [Sandaracinaceae bacterium]|nr:acyl-CoA desaturase [Sandaracinaceae bacterium]
MSASTGGGASPDVMRVRPDRLARDRWIFSVIIVGPALCTLAAFASLPWLGLTWLDVALFGIAYVVSVLGVEVGYHRLFSHRAFAPRRAVLATLAVMGATAGQGTIQYWVSQHRHHHRYADTPSDLHTPYGRGGGLRGRLRGIWHAHLGWIFAPERALVARYARDVLADPLLVRIDRLYLVWLALGLAVPPALAALLTGAPDAALRAFLWAGAVRMCAVQHVSYAISSLCHMYGSRTFESGDEARNNAWLALPTLGGSWHNNHHAFPASAFNDLEPWQADPCGWLIRLLVALRLAARARRPTRAMLDARRLDHTRRSA